jgi:hypothetical protein
MGKGVFLAWNGPQLAIDWITSIDPRFLDNDRTDTAISRAEIFP